TSDSRQFYYHSTIKIVIFSFFFFSSRRRHTRCLSDWSSDVCSSDLSQVVPVPRPESNTIALPALGSGPAVNPGCQLFPSHSQVSPRCTCWVFIPPKITTRCRAPSYALAWSDRGGAAEAGIRCIHDAVAPLYSHVSPCVAPAAFRPP